MNKTDLSMNALWQDSYLAGGETYLENLYEQYLKDPQSVDEKWRNFFAGLPPVSNQPEVSHQAIQEYFLRLARESASKTIPDTMGVKFDQREVRVMELINAYRTVGHLKADLDPLGLAKRQGSPILELSYYGFTDADLTQTFSVGNYSALGKEKATLAEIYKSLESVYSRTLGVEYKHINHSDQVEWIRDRIENGWSHFIPDNALSKHILDRLIVADGIEKYLGFKYVGQKRFSLEGGDALIPLMDTIVKRSAETGVRESVIGMAHRGRLNVLVNIVGKDPKAIFAAFEGKGISKTHSGDVKYHLGFSSDVQTPYGCMHIALAFNPSHLEIVSPVVQGSVRARQRRRRDTNTEQVIALQLHGDAAFSSQGVVMETFSMSQARWFTVGGSVHIVINNQIGFTISDPKDARSSTYCTDSAKMIEAPILHVNGNDPEAVYFAALFAIDYRQTFKRDAVIDLICYRRHGHNEADEPSATQPIMYSVIKTMPVPYQIYAKKLIEKNLITEDEVKKMVDSYRDALDKGQAVVEVAQDKTYEFMVNWEPFVDTKWDEKVNTALPLKKLTELGKQLEKIPDNFVLQAQVKKMLENEKKMTAGELPLNWGYAESLAYASLLVEGYPIRLCGQDAARGTFAHRHAVLHDQKTNEIYIPLSHVGKNQAQINLVDSLLSEEAVLAFEYGYATAEPNYLVIWEAQFGDFANGAQVVIDQFISSGEQKWARLCGLVMLLPHGYEGQGPEHSSARLERYLQLCAQDNMQVCVPTTPAQIFHLLRRQMLRPYRKPLIVMSPKSVLRNPLAVSQLTDLSEGEFQLVVPEIDKMNKADVSQVIFCCGKVYYELLEARREQKMNDIAILRIEQLYPFPSIVIEKLFNSYTNATDIVWCQEEPQNQGAWPSLEPHLTALLKPNQTLRYEGRAEAASPAVGYHAVHEKEQIELVANALKRRKK